MRAKWIPVRWITSFEALTCAVDEYLGRFLANLPYGFEETPLLGGMIGGWELILIFAVVAIPAAIVGVVVLVIYLFSRDRCKGNLPPPIPTEPRK